MKLHLNKALRILVFTDAIVLIASSMIGPIYALYVDKIGGDLLDASLAGAAFAGAAGVTVLLAGRTVDKIKENELVIVFGYCIIGIGFLLYMLAGNIWHLLAIQILIGFGQAIGAPAFDSVFAKHIVKKKSGRQWSIWESANYFATAVGACIGGFIAVKLGFSVLFIVMASLCFISAMYIYHLPRKVL